MRDHMCVCLNIDCIKTDILHYYLNYLKSELNQEDNTISAHFHTN